MAANRQMIRSLWRDIEVDLTARGESWLPSRRLLLGVPELQSGETFSSWIYRSAVSCRIPLRQLKTIWGVKTSPYWVDCGIAKMDAGIIAATVNHGDIAAIEGSRWSPHSYLASWRGLCLTAEPLWRRPIYRYCEECLREDEIPFFRKSWRLASNYVCTEHGMLLREQCPTCGLRIDLNEVGENPSKTRQASVILRYCQHCGADLCMMKKQKKLHSSSYEILANAQLTMQLSIYDASKTRQNSYPHDSYFDSPISADSLSQVMWQILLNREQEKTARFSVTLDKYIAQHFNNTNGAYYKVYGGVNGVQLFHEHADHIRKEFKLHKRRFESTFWITSGKVATLPLAKIKDAITWHKTVMSMS